VRLAQRRAAGEEGGVNGHHIVVLNKRGEETGLPLQSASCSCGWRSNIWYAGSAFVMESYGRHIDAVKEGSTVPWMVAPGSVA
jgi:hypothetical protein